MAEKKLTICIVSYNTKHLTSQAVASVISYPAASIVVVDNASSDGSVEYLRTVYGNQIQIIAQKENGGFAKANNAALTGAKTPYVLLLNSDTIANLDAIDQMIQYLDTHPEYGVVSSTLCDAMLRYQPQGGSLPTPLVFALWWLWPLPFDLPFVPQYQNSQKPSDLSDGADRGWVGGTAMMIRTSVWNQLKGLDESIFMYGEDVDFCFRAHDAGHLVRLLNGAPIVHYGSASSASTTALKGELKGMRLFYQKRYSRFLWMFSFVVFCGAMLRYLLFGILGKSAQSRALYREILWNA